MRNLDLGHVLSLSVMDAPIASVRGDRADGWTAHGLGLGLSICRSIIEAYGGRLWASANAPRGAVFHFTLPVNQDIELPQ